MGQDAVNGHGDAWKEGQQFWNTTITNVSRGAEDLWKSPTVTVIRIEILVSLVAGVLLLLAIFGSRRRRSRNWFVQKGVLGAYTLSFSVATYTLGSMQSSGVKSSMYPIWAISLFMLHGCTDSITAYSLDDNGQVTRLAYEVVMYCAYAVLLLATVQTGYSTPLGYMAVIALVRYGQRLAACGLASFSWNLNKTVADYMYDDQNKAVFVTMEDCSYLVDWPLRKSKFDPATYATKLTSVDTPEKDEAVIDIGKIWRCKDMSLCPKVKDTCLSFSLFHLLRRRFFGFACDESKDRARNFVLEVLLSENQGGGADYNRVFEVIEVELAFMYDFFFTKYAAIYYGSTAATIWSLISVIGISVTTYITVRAPVKITQNNTPIVSTVTDDIVITLVILASIALLQFLQLLLYWTGIWGRVSFVCRSLREETRLNRRASQRKKIRTRGSCFIMGLKDFASMIDVCLAPCIMGLEEFLAKIGVWLASNKHYWRHKNGQYSLLDSVSCNPNPSQPNSMSIRRFYNIVERFICLLDFTFIHPINDQVTRVRGETRTSVELPDEVKEAVLRSLKDTGGNLSNGKSFLESNGGLHLSWACDWRMHSDHSWSQRNQNQTHIILTWHIATCYCEMVALSPEEAEELKVHFSIATKLSKYCAYLVVSAPKLLPGHHYDTRSKFDAAAVEAVAFLERKTSKYDAMKNLTVPEETKTIFESGVKLGQQLELMEEGVRWKVMADFWAEMMIYLAPSDNVEAHIEQLAQGGEFITHLWALLSHAGILGREQAQPAGGV